MITLQDTTGSSIVNAFIRERRSTAGVTSGIALTLIVVVDEARVEEALDAASHAAANHPARVLVVVRSDLSATASRLDAEVCVGERMGTVESVSMRMSGPVASHAESVVLPLLAPDVPVITWWHGVPPVRTENDPLGVLADRRITDCWQADDPLAALAQRATDYTPGDTDIAWTRTTPWRALLAGTFDTVNVGAATISISTGPTNPTGALLAGWLTHRLGIQPEFIDRPGDRIYEVLVTLTDDNQVRITRENENMGRVHRSGLPPRLVPLQQRTLAERLADELRHLDPDQPYEAALKAWHQNIL